jgi:hypothetical protein
MEKFKIWVVYTGNKMEDYTKSEKVANSWKERGLDVEELEVEHIATYKENNSYCDIVKDMKSGDYFSLGPHSWDEPITSMTKEEVEEIILINKIKNILNNSKTLEEFLQKLGEENILWDFNALFHSASIKVDDLVLEIQDKFGIDNFDMEQGNEFDIIITKDNKKYYYNFFNKKVVTK